MVVTTRRTTRKRANQEITPEAQEVLQKAKPKSPSKPNSRAKTAKKPKSDVQQENEASAKSGAGEKSSITLPEKEKEVETGEEGMAEQPKLGDQQENEASAKSAGAGEKSSITLPEKEKEVETGEEGMAEQPKLGVQQENEASAQSAGAGEKSSITLPEKEKEDETVEEGMAEQPKLDVQQENEASAQSGAGENFSITLPEKENPFHTPVEPSVMNDALKWRLNFMDAHNASPTILANSLYPDGIQVTKLHGTQSDDPAQAKQGHTVKDLCRALATRFVEDMKQVGLQVDWNRNKRRELWDEEAAIKLDKFIKNTNTDRKIGKIGEPRMEPGSEIPFFCQRCIQHKQLGLIAVGKFEGGCSKKAKGQKPVEGQAGPAVGGSKKAKEKPVIKQDHLSNYRLRIQEIYYHSCECTVDLTPDFLKYRDSSYVQLAAPYAWIFGDRYAKLENFIGTFCLPPPFLSPQLTKKEADAIRNRRKDVGFTTADRAKDFPKIGEPINLGIEDYRYDNRMYLALPGHPTCDELPMELHRMSMARLFFFLVCRFGIQDQASPFNFSKLAFIDRWWNNRKDTTGKARNFHFTGLFAENKAATIALKEISALFGGNEWEVCGDEPIHQYCHLDCPLLPRADADTQFKPGPSTFVPGSFIAPMTLDGRRIYIRSPEHTIDIPFGSILVFSGDLPHGGITEKAGGTNLGHRLCIHGHLDHGSITRQQTLLQISGDPNVYRPPEHMIVFEDDFKQQLVVEACQRLQTMWKFVHQQLKAPTTTKTNQQYDALVKDLKVTKPFSFLNKQTSQPTQPKKSGPKKGANKRIGKK